MFFCRRCSVLALRGNVTMQRAESTLAERMKRAAEGVQSTATEAEQRAELESQLDEKGEQFRELYVMPKRKLRTQLELERLTGRAEPVQFPQRDIHDRNAVRRPRREEMETDQDWPSVWPVAASFRSSVVPLPVRMGTRKKPDKKPPFQTLGNLELVKIPNFLHLTPAAIERHCKAIRKFCTKWPPELDGSVQVHEAGFPVTVSFSDYAHQGTSLRDPRCRIVTLKVKVSSLSLSSTAKEKLMRLAGDRYCVQTGVLTLVTDRCYTRKQNLDYAMYLLTALYHESNKAEKWEKLAQTADSLEVHFDGSEAQKIVMDAAARAASASKQECVSSSEETRAADEKEVKLKVKRFGEFWEEYRNTPETPELVRRYADSVRRLLAVPSVDASEKKKVDTFV